jgi:hypothetical protein
MKLLAAHHHDRFAAHSTRTGQVNTLTTQYSVYPKVKMGADGHLRYLTLSTWLYQRDRQPVSLDAMGDLTICPHLGFGPYHAPPNFSFDPGLWRYPYWKLDQLAIAIKTAFGQHDVNGTVVSEVHGACHRCPTDFTVQASPDWAKLCVWRDLGPEGSPTSLAWKVHIRGLLPPHRNIINSGLTLAHEPGSVRALYNAAGEYWDPSPVTDTAREKT